MVRRIVRNNLKKSVTREYIISIKEIVEAKFNELLTESEKEFNEVNRYREIQCLPKMKRYDVSILKNVLDELFNHKQDFKHGEIGNCQPKQTTILSEAVEVA